jgi:hypothetical protein
MRSHLFRDETAESVVFADAIGGMDDAVHNDIDPPGRVETPLAFGEILETVTAFKINRRHSPR